MTRAILALALLAAAAPMQRQPPTSAPQPAPSAQPPGGRGPSTSSGRAGGRGGVQVMTLTSSAFTDGGSIPAKYTQAGGEISPSLAWSGAPDGTASFVLIVHDPDAAIGNGTDDILQWLVWNIPASARGLPERIPHGPDLRDGAHQISATGPFYRGPGAPAGGPAHHYTFELFALDTAIDVPAVGQSPAQTRAAVVAAMAGHVRGKGVLVGFFKR
ncbi:MAG TPA: YbhB/YbcL family Raf kinase inhibitor-like protein [Vicinamibacterales bacterium]|nr:YbhB/YbcL family Raf kinase inhibitor-like protein [Vicinamibacterales bacterium]